MRREACGVANRVLPLSSTLHTPAVGEPVERWPDLAKSVSVDPSARVPTRIDVATAGRLVRILAIVTSNGTIPSIRENSDDTSTDGGLTWEYLATADLAQVSAASPGSAEWNVVADRDQCYLGQFERRRHFLERCCNHFDRQFHTDAGGIRSGPLPSAAVDGAGTVWVVWEDCRFRAMCATNDLVYSTSTDGVNWSAVTRVPIDDTSSTADYFIPGIGIDPATTGSSAHVALHYYTIAERSTVSTANSTLIYCVSERRLYLNVPVAATGPMMNWLPNHKMADGGDYVATVFTNGAPRRRPQWRAPFRVRRRGIDLYGAGSDSDYSRSAAIVGCDASTSYRTRLNRSDQRRG